MRIRYYIWMIGLLLVSCVNDREPAEEETGTKNDTSETVYLNLRILSSDDAFTRADGNVSGSGVGESYDTGTADESAVFNGRIYIFEGSSEENAVCVAYAEIGERDVIQETAGFLSVKNLECRNLRINAFGTDFELDEEGHYFALALLNVSDDFPFPQKDAKFIDWATTPVTNNMLLTVTVEENNKPLTDTEEKTTKTYTYITMANATGMLNTSNSVLQFKPTTLFPIYKEDFTKGEKSASEPIKTVIIVQRNVARVNLIPNIDGFLSKNVRIGQFNVQVSIANWCLEVTNTETYPVMNIIDLSWAQHATSGFWDIGSSQYYNRVFWAKDPNYHSESILSSKSNTPFGDSRTPQYCLENTMDYDCMLQGQTTRVVVRGRWQHENYQEDAEEKWGYVPPGYNFYEDNDYKFGVFYRIGNQENIYCRKCFKDKAKQLFNSNNLSFEWLDVRGGYYPLKELLKISDNGNEITDAQYTRLAQAFGLMNADKDPISYYENCHCYYVLRIPHFSDRDVPWDNENEVTTKADGTRIANYSEKHLGRYGVLRNVSYEVTVESIHSLGSPCIPEITDDDTDDMPDQQLMGVEIKVLPWRYVDQGDDLFLGE